MLKKLLIGLAVLLLAVGGVAYWFWHQATALPEWYAEIDDADASEPAPTGPLQWAVVPDAESDKAAPKSAEAPQKPKRVRREIRDFHMRAHVKNPAARKAFRASRATYEDGRLEAGVIVNAGKVPQKELSKKDKGFFERLIKAFPSLADRDVYVALEDEPIVAPDGILQLGPNPKVRVGNLSYSLAQVAKKLGVSTKAVRKDINAELRRMKVMDPEHLARLPVSKP